MAIVNNLNLRKELQNLSFKSFLEGSISSHTLPRHQYRSAAAEVVLFFKQPRFKFPEMYDLYWQEISATSQDPSPVFFVLFSGGLPDKY